jgi:hypothetical protein
MTPAPARTNRRTHNRRTTTTTRHHRRVSGPVNRRMVATPAGAATLPRRSGTTGLFARVRALPEHRVVDRLLRSRAWIWALGALLGGIVAMQVSLLKLNSGISRAVETTTTLERQNAGLEQDIARLSRTDRIQDGAASLNMILPAAGDVGYLTAGPEDAARAARRMQPPSEAAAALLANGGIVPGSLAEQAVQAGTATVPTIPADPATVTTTTTPPPADTTTAAATAPPPTEPVATPTPAPVQQTTPPTTTSPASQTGGVTAPQG